MNCCPKTEYVDIIYFEMKVTKQLLVKTEIMPNQNKKTGNDYIRIGT